MIRLWIVLFATLGDAVSLPATYLIIPNNPFQSTAAQYIRTAPEATLDCVCGQSNDELAFRIVGGVNTKPHQYPWQVAILTPAGNLYCGGSIISDQHILTAGHCVYYTDPRRLNLLIGAHDLRKSDGQLYRVFRVLLHPEFKALRFMEVSDAAIIIPTQRIRFTPFVRPICLPRSADADYSYRRATVTGWGHLWENGPAADILRATKLMVLTEKQCERSAIASWYDPRRMVCAYAKRRDSCQGDSGGPLMVQSSLRRWEQIGLVSFGIGCGTPNYPGVYVPVTYLLPWLDEVMQGAGVCRDPVEIS